jgi:hypothetical protein
MAEMVNTPDETLEYLQSLRKIWDVEPLARR